MTQFSVAVLSDSHWVTDVQATREKTAFFQAYPAHMSERDLHLIYCAIPLAEVERQIKIALQDVTAPDATGPHNARAALAYRRFLDNLQTWKEKGN